MIFSRLRDYSGRAPCLAFCHCTKCLTSMSILSLLLVFWLLPQCFSHIFFSASLTQRKRKREGGAAESPLTSCCIEEKSGSISSSKVWLCPLGKFCFVCFYYLIWIILNTHTQRKEFCFITCFANTTTSSDYCCLLSTQVCKNIKYFKIKIQIVITECRLQCAVQQTFICRVFLFAFSFNAIFVFLYLQLKLWHFWIYVKDMTSKLCKKPSNKCIPFKTFLEKLKIS